MFHVHSNYLGSAVATKPDPNKDKPKSKGKKEERQTERDINRVQPKDDKKAAKGGQHADEEAANGLLGLLGLKRNKKR